MNKKLKARTIEIYGTQEDFAQACKLDRTVVSRVVRQRRTLNHDEARRWAKALECEVSIIQGRA